MSDQGSPFDRVISRRNTRSYKWDTLPDGVDRGDLLPMWVADMDFTTAPAVLDALRALIDHGIFGYTQIADSVYDAYRSWVLKRRHADLPREWMLYTQGVLAALTTAVTTLSSPGDGVIIQPPVYYPFGPLVRHNGRRVLENPLVLRDNKWSIDLRHLDEVASQGAKVLLLCSPHNPVGRVWTSSELEGLLDVCRRHSILIISDEIHADIIMPGHEHHPLFALGKGTGVEVVVLASPSKTFNLAGTPMAWMIAPNTEIREKLKRALTAAHAGSGNVFAVTAAETAYRDCEEWLDELIVYLTGNRDVLERELVGAVPGLSIAPLEGTYLAWIDFRRVRGNGVDLKQRMLNDAGLWLNDGKMFGTGGTGFQRINLAAPRSLVLEATARIRRAFC